MNENRKFVERMHAVGLDPVTEKHFGGIVHFKAITGEQASKLLEIGAADPKDAQNDAPTFQEITTFLAANPKFVGHGYIVLPKREDARITLEGVISHETLSREEILAFIRMFRNADEFELSDTVARAWYD